MSSIINDIDIIKKEISRAISDLKLNLNGLTILTEAATGLFSLTPFIALKAGAQKVYAISQNTRYGSINDIKILMDQLFESLGPFQGNIIVVDKKDFNQYHEVDIVTNLGHVRPVNAAIVNRLSKKAVISYMCEPWEFREGDIDVQACKAKGIKIYGTDENHPLVDCFKEVGILAIKMLIEAGISLFNSKIAIISRDKFGISINKSLLKFSDNIGLYTNFQELKKIDFSHYDALIVADYLYQGIIIGEEGLIDPVDLKKKAPALKLIQFCGNNCISEILKNRVSAYPEIELPPSRMCYTLADSSYKAFIRLHTGGLKVGEGMIHCRQKKMNDTETKEYMLKNYPALSF